MTRPTMPALPALLALLVWGCLGCTPTVQVQAPAEPIVINLNVKIEHEVRVKVDKELDQVFEDEQDLF
ncbi:MAG: YnbE family lipoprotein [Deltaproteobacteria bacterium]|nr:YnbE family lipoprotein [Deltaproteobacteria bacterium]MBW2394760.1 YnbE family lipoprotein [Deltaproteobacteria bacterium]